jgi:hypothetical protein
MALIDGVKAICDRLAPLGWNGLLKAVTASVLDIEQKTPQGLREALTLPLPQIDRTRPGFEDFDLAGTHGITAGRPSQSLLYHALASPRVLRDENGALLRGFPTLSEIEAIENFIFGIQPATLASIKQSSGASKLAVVVFATEYRPGADTADGAHADLTLSRTGIARIGTARSKYLPEVRGYWAEDEDNPHGFRVIPVRFTAWLAAPVKGQDARVMRLTEPDAEERKRIFWIPVHKLFDGTECIQGLDLSLTCSAKFFNMKLQRALESLKQKPPSRFPYVIEDGLAELREGSEFGRVAVVPVVQERLVQAAIIDGKPLTYPVPPQDDQAFATYETKTRVRDDAEIHPFPAYVHARTMVVDNTFVNLNDQPNVRAAVSKGNYDALLYLDRTGEGWVDVQVPQLKGKAGIEAASRAAYLLLSAPDFFPSCGQRELSRWADSQAVPKSFRGQIWGINPAPLSEIRLPANLQLPGSPFDPDEETMTAVLGMGTGTQEPSPAQ